MCPPHAVVPVGGHATDSWGRCSKCGAWVWRTDDDSKFQFSNEWVLDAELADRALLQGDPRAAAKLLVENDLPYGPVWTTPSALIEMLRAITPSANDRARSEALDAVPPKDRWVDAANLLRELATKTGPVASELVFEMDIGFPGRTFFETYEVGDALVMFEAREMVRITKRAGVTSAPLPDQAVIIARVDDVLLFESGGRLFRLDGSGALDSMPFTQGYRVRPFDGWWVFVPRDGHHIEIHRPDLQPLVKLPTASKEVRVRKMGDGFVVAGCIDDEGNEQALTLFDASFRMIAQSKNAHGQRSIAPIDGNALWCETNDPPYTLERWQRRDGELVRTFDLAVQSWTRVDGGVLVRPRDPNAPITRFDDDGARRFGVRRDDWEGAAYFQKTKAGMLVYDDASAEIFDVTSGARRAKWRLESPRVLVASEGTVFVQSQGSLWTIGALIAGGAPLKLFVGEHMRLETTCGDAALLRDGHGACVLVGSDGAPRARFEARNTSFSVMGTRGGPYVVEPGRVRISCFPR